MVVDVKNRHLTPWIAELFIGKILELRKCALLKIIQIYSLAVSLSQFIALVFISFIDYWLWNGLSGG